MLEEPVKTDEIQRINGKFAPGVSGNPAGKPKGTKHLTSLLYAALQKKVQEGKNAGKTYQDLLIERVLSDAIVKGKGDIMRMAWNYVDGMPDQAIDVTTDGEKITSGEANIMAMAQEINDRLRKKKMD